MRKIKGNKYIINGDYAEMIIESKTYGNFRVLLDLEEVDKCKDYTWCIRGYKGMNYVYSSKLRKEIQRFIMNTPKGLITDHINGDTLDNRKHNLRIVNHNQNGKNQKVHKNNTSGYSGVSYIERVQRWKARINVDGKDIYLGYYDTFEQAKTARIQAEKKYYKDFRRVG